MASIRKRSGHWQVQIRRKGQPARSGTFASLKSARQWVNEQEYLADLGENPQSLPAVALTAGTAAPLSPAQHLSPTASAYHGYS